MGNSGSRGGGGGGSGSKGNSICGIDRRDIRSITHEYSSDKSKTGTLCITSNTPSSKAVTDCFSTHYRESYPSGHSNSRGGEGSSGGGNSTGSSVNTGSGSNTNSTENESNSSVVISSIPPRESYIANPYAPKHVKALESYLFTKYGGYEALRKGIILGSNSVHGRFQLDALVNGQKPPSESWAMKNMVGQLTGMSLSVKGREETVPSVVKVITLCDNNICDYDLLKLQTSCFAYRSKLNLDGLYLHHNQITDVGVKYLLNAYVPDSGLKITQPLLDRIVQENIKGFINAPSYRSMLEINLSNNQIGDEGAKLLADSLSNGEMPNLKKLQLESNKITDEGKDALINALKNETVQDVIITAMTLYEKYELNISGTPDRKMSILQSKLDYAKSRGVDVDNVVVEKTTWGWIKNKYQLYKGLSVGWTKCFISYDDIESFAGERLLAKASKRLSWVNDVKDGVLCYFEADNEALLTESGVRDIKYQMLEVQETSELIGNIEVLHDTLHD